MKLISEKIVDNVKIQRFEDENGKFHDVFTTLPTEKEEEKTKTTENLSWWKRLVNWWNSSDVKPYVKTRDFNKQGEDPFRPEDIASKKGVEVGIKVTF